MKTSTTPPTGSIHHLLLAIETSCDDTSVALLETASSTGDTTPGWVNIRSFLTQNQDASHIPFGGVVPEVAARDHLAVLEPLVHQCLAQGKCSLKDIQSIAVTFGPGLIGTLMVGVLFGRGLAQGLGVPLKAINHIHAHLAPALLMPQVASPIPQGQWIELHRPTYPLLYLTVSGGHCHLGLLHSSSQRDILGRSVDDACGESFDKVAKMFGLPYPGGPHVEKLAAQVTGSPLVFPSPSVRAGPYLMSFSGLKTAVQEALKAHSKDISHSHIAFAFQEAALGQLHKRLAYAIEQNPHVSGVCIAGGVAANTRFRNMVTNLGVPLFWAPRALCTDNAVMIGLQSFLESSDGFANQPYSKV